MSTTPKITMIGMYNHDEKLFDEMTLPPEINKEDFINTFLLNYGEFPVMYPSWQILKFAIGVWSKKWYHSIERIIRAMTEEYDPLHNFDRHELYTDTENKSEKNTMSYGSTITETDSREISTDGTNEAEVSAYNEDDYQPDNKQTINNTESHSGSIETERDGKDTNDMTGNRGLTHEGHLYGNIGVTESTSMLLHEKELRMSNNILDIVAEMLFKEVCIYTY